MIKIAFSKNGKEDEKDILRIAKKSGYKAKKTDENKVWITYDLEKIKAGAPTKKINNAKEIIEEMRKKGISIKDIAKALGVTRSTVYRYVK